MNPWELLGIPPTSDTRAIRHAYAEKTRLCHPEEDPEGFDRLHTAFTEAMRLARRGPKPGGQAPQGPAAEKADAPGGAETFTASREECLAAEREALRRAAQAKAAPPAQKPAEPPAAGFDFSAASGGPKSAGSPAAKPFDAPGREGEKRPPAGRTGQSGRDFDFGRLPAQESRQRAQDAQELLERLRDACGPDAEAWEAREMLDEEDFLRQKDSPEFLALLAQMLENEPECLEKAGLDLAWAYGVPAVADGQVAAPGGAYEPLFALLLPLWQRHKERQKQGQAKIERGRDRFYALCAAGGVFFAQLATLYTLGWLTAGLAAAGGAALAAAAVVLVRRAQRAGRAPRTGLLVLRLAQALALACFAFGMGPRSAAGLLFTFVLAAAPGRRWYFKRDKRARRALIAFCFVMIFLWVPASMAFFPDASSVDSSFGAVLSWCAFPAAFIRCLWNERRFYQLAARYGL